MASKFIENTRYSFCGEGHGGLGTRLMIAMEWELHVHRNETYSLAYHPTPQRGRGPFCNGHRPKYYTGDLTSICAALVRKALLKSCNRGKKLVGLKTRANCLIPS